MEFILALAVMAATIWPSVKILNRLGFSRWWALLMIVPFGFIVGLWLLAFSRWPNFGNTLSPDTSEVFN